MTKSISFYTSCSLIIHTLLSDTDECSEGLNACDDNASCTNTQGGYNCTCNTGYAGNGSTCSGTYVCMYISENIMPRTNKKIVINPRHACAARVTVLALFVCVCVFRRNPSSLRPKSSTYRFIIGFCWISTRGISKKPSVQEIWRHLLTTITAARSMALFSTG